VRWIISVFILFCAATLQATLAVPIARAGLSLDLLLVCVVCISLLAGEWACLVAALGAGLLKDCFSVLEFGRSAAVFIPLALLLSRLRRMLWVGHWTTQAACAFTATFAAWLLYALYRWLGGAPPDMPLGSTVRQAFLNAAAAPPVFLLWRAVLAD
jgi:rod shape-determining protein MreD